MDCILDSLTTESSTFQTFSTPVTDSINVPSGCVDEFERDDFLEIFGQQSTSNFNISPQQAVDEVDDGLYCLNSTSDEVPSFHNNRSAITTSFHSNQTSTTYNLNYYEPNSSSLESVYCSSPVDVPTEQMGTANNNSNPVCTFIHYDAVPLAFDCGAPGSFKNFLYQPNSQDSLLKQSQFHSKSFSVSPESDEMLFNASSGHLLPQQHTIYDSTKCISHYEQYQHITETSCEDKWTSRPSERYPGINSLKWFG